LFLSLSLTPFPCKCFFYTLHSLSDSAAAIRLKFHPEVLFSHPPFQFFTAWFVKSPHFLLECLYSFSFPLIHFIIEFRFNPICLAGIYLLPGIALSSLSTGPPPCIPLFPPFFLVPPAPPSSLFMYRRLVGFRMGISPLSPPFFFFPSNLLPPFCPCPPRPFFFIVAPSSCVQIVYLVLFPPPLCLPLCFPYLDFPLLRSRTLFFRFPRPALPPVKPRWWPLHSQVRFI